MIWAAIDEVTVRWARIVVDSREACLAEAGDLVIPGVSPDAEIGEIVNGSAPGRQDDEGITFFKSVGVAAQDAAAAAAVVNVAEEKGLGSVAFPAIGTGVGGLSSHMCARAMLDETLEFLQESQNLRQVVFALFDGSTYKAFQQRLSEMFSAHEHP